MSSEKFLTEYFENMSEFEEDDDGIVTLDIRRDQPKYDFSDLGGKTEPPKEAYIMSFTENDLQDYDEKPLFEDFEELTFEEPLDVADLDSEFYVEDSFYEEGSHDDPETMIESLDSIEEKLDDGIEFLEEEVDEEDDLKDETSNLDDKQHESGNFLPGVSEPIVDADDADDMEQEPETNWADDKDTTKFIVYLRDSYANIPQHNGQSISGCERALTYLNKLNKEISEAVRIDDKNALDDVLEEIEDYRVKILKGMVALKQRVGILKKKLKEEGAKKASLSLKDMVKQSMEADGEIIKEAKSGAFQVVITPFERAICGILINSVVSAGHPFEEVYEYLKDKFDLDEREELAIIQIIMDMGLPIFKDRGLIGGESDGKSEGHHIDFIKNYLA